MASQERPKSCAFCRAEKTDLLKCSRCKSTCYCNTECQRSHWKVHKKSCKAPDANFPSVVKAAKPQEMYPKASYQMDQARIADFVCTKLNSNGYCVLDDFLPDHSAKQVLCEVKTLEETGVFKDGQLSGGLTGSENDEKFTEKHIRGDRITWVEGNEPGVSQIREYMQRVDSLVMQCCGATKNLGGYDIQGRTKAMVACYPGQRTGYKRHVDNPDGDGRCLTVICYLNDCWVESDGGELRIFRGKSHINIEPLLNRVLLFWSDKRNPHEVLPSNFTRYALTVWYFDKEERSKAKALHKHKRMGDFGVEVAIKDFEEKKVDRDLAQAKLDEESERLVKNMMSDDELDAMAVLIKDHPDPRAMLSSMYGISPSILDALLRVLERRKKIQQSL